MMYTFVFGTFLLGLLGGFCRRGLGQMCHLLVLVAVVVMWGVPLVLAVGALIYLMGLLYYCVLRNLWRMYFPSGFLDGGKGESR